MHKTIVHTYKYIDINDIEREHNIMFSPIINNVEVYPPASMYTLQCKLSDIFNNAGNTNIIDKIIPLEKYENELGNRNFLFIDNLNWNIFECNMEVFQIFSSYKICPIFNDSYIALYSLLEFLQIQSKNNKEKPSYEDLDEIWDYWHHYTLDTWNKFPDDYYIYVLNKES